MNNLDVTLTDDQKQVLLFMQKKNSRLHYMEFTANQLSCIYYLLEIGLVLDNKTKNNFVPGEKENYYSLSYLGEKCLRKIKSTQ